MPPVHLSGELQDFNNSILFRSFFGHSENLVGDIFIKAVLSAVITNLRWDLSDDHDGFAPLKGDRSLAELSIAMLADYASHEVLLVLKTDSRSVGSESSEALQELGLWSGG